MTRSPINWPQRPEGEPSFWWGTAIVIAVLVVGTLIAGVMP